MARKLAVCLLLALASMLAFADGSKRDVCPREDSAFAEVEKRAQADDPVAETVLASCYDLGQHVAPDGKQSIHWLTEAASRGYGPAQYELGRIYLYGRGVPADYAKALIWESKAAEQGDARAQRDLAFMYERGFGVPVDPAKAAEWNRKAAAQGEADAQLQLAKALDQGSGVAKNPDEAHNWYLKAANQEQAEAQLQLARQLAAKPDCAGAIHWYTEAAAQGEATAMHELGQLYLDGRCGRNRTAAFQWFTISARFGSAEGKSKAEKLSAALTKAQKASAQGTAERWIRQHSGAKKDEDEEER
jgi:uncharacterized protein